MTKRFKRLLFLAAVMTGVCTQAYAWDQEPDENGLYDGLYNRPTYFPDWEQPDEWPNAMYMLCEVRMESAQGERVESYEIAVYDSDNNLRRCDRSLVKDNHYCLLTIPGTEGDTFHFEVLYGEDFANPKIAKISGVTVDFETNKSIGSKTEPYVLILSNTPTGIENLTPTGDGRTYDILGRPVSNPTNGLYIIDGRKYIIH
jgi:hypothetical protein